jgi:hypothetical protein
MASEIDLCPYCGSLPSASPAPAPALGDLVEPVAWRATKGGCEVGLFYDEDIARENTTDALIEPLFALSPRP